MLPSTDLLNLNLNLNWKGIAGSPIDLAPFASNVTNEKYRVATAGEFVLLGEPRIYGMRLKYRFGE